MAFPLAERVPFGTRETADSQLLVATSTLVEDLYVRLFGARTKGKRLVLLSRLATIAVPAIAFALALDALRDQSGGGSLIDTMVAYAWTGLGSSFGPALLLALWWKRTTGWGVLAGMVSGMIATVVWLLDIKAAAVLISATLVLLVSLLGRPAHGAQPAAAD